MLINEFKNQFGVKINKFFNDKNKEFIFNFNYINSFCDHLLSNILENSDLSDLEKYDFNIQELNEYCQKFSQYNLEEIECGNKDVIFMSLSPTMRQLILWMDNRIKINEEGNELYINDSPKYTIWSAHDSSLAANEMFFKYIFGTKFINPIVGSSIIIELHKNESKQNENYYIQYFVNDELLLEIEYNFFKTNILKYLWNEDNINKFCKFSETSDYESRIYIYQVLLTSIILLFVLSIYINSKLFVKLKNLNKKNNKDYELKDYLNK